MALGFMLAGFALGYTRSPVITKAVPVDRPIYITKEAPSTTTTEYRGPSYRCIVNGWPITTGIEQAARIQHCERIN
jgi:hypothetical protein